MNRRMKRGLAAHSERQVSWKLEHEVSLFLTQLFEATHEISVDGSHCRMQMKSESR